MRSTGCLPSPRYEGSLDERTDRNAACGTSMLPMVFIFFLPSFCFCRSFIFRVLSPPPTVFPDFVNTSFLNGGIRSRATILLPIAACKRSSVRDKDQDQNATIT